MKEIDLGPVYNEDEAVDMYEVAADVADRFQRIAIGAGEHWQSILFGALLLGALGLAKGVNAQGPVTIVDQDTVVNPGWASQHMSTFSQKQGDQLGTGSEPRRTTWSGVCSRTRGKQPTCYETTAIGW